MISFEPTDAVAPPRNVSIENGKYRVDGNRALPPGTYRVRITAPKPSQANRAHGRPK